jgi:hypothetical protein
VEEEGWGREAWVSERGCEVHLEYARQIKSIHK